MKIIENDKTSNILIVIGSIFLIFAAIFFLWNVNLFDFSVPINSEKFGQFGDFVGGVVGTIWALAGVVLFYIALVEQRKDIKINSDTLKLQLTALNQQVEEFELQRSEMESSRKVYEQQSKTLKLQQFDSNFFSLLNLYLSIKQNLNALSQSKDYFKEQYDEIILEYDWDSNIKEDHISQVENYETFYSENSGMLSNYYRSVYRVLKIIDSSLFLEEFEKDHYSKIFRAQLSDYEQVLLFYNSFSVRGKKTKKLILRYDLFKNLPALILPYFKPYKMIQGNHNIASILEDIEAFIILNISKYFDIEFSEESISVKNELFNCILSMQFHSNLTIEVHCNNDISENGFNLTNDQFLKLFESIVLYNFLFKRYINGDDFELYKSKEETESENIFRLTINFNEETNFNFRIGANK